MQLMRLAAISAAAALLATSVEAQTISIGTSPVGSLNYSLGNALGKVMTEQGGLRARVVPFGGGQQFLPLIGKGELEMAIPSASDALFALKGEAAFEGNPTPDLRVIGTVFPYYVGFFVRRDAPYKSLTDLKGKRFPVGFTANSAQRRIYLAGLAAEGLTEADFDGVQVPHVVRAADDFMQGKVEATTFAVGAGKVTEVDSKIGIRYLNMPDTPQALAGIKKFMPTTYIGTVQPAAQFAGIIGPTKVMFEDYLVLAGRRMSDDDAYKIAKLLYEHQDKLAAVAEAFSRYNKAELARDHGIPFHPGAIKFYKEVGIWKGQ
jgi:TRAP transporter TAXI family solute receptor